MRWFLRIADARKLAAFLAVSLPIGMAPSPVVRAQSVLAGNGDLLVDKIIGVQDRPRPEYDPLGIRIGGFQLTPQLQIEETYDDNIYATQSDTVSDFLTSTTASLALSSQAPGSASASGSVTSNRYLHNSIEDYVDYSVGGALEFSPSLAAFSATGEFGHSHLSRKDPSFPVDADTPPALNTSGGTLDIRHPLTRGSLDLNVQFRALNYLAAQLPGGASLPQSFKDHDELTFDLRDNILIQSNVSAFLRYIHKNYDDYDDNTASEPLNRNAVVDTAGAGTDFQLTNLMKGEIGAGVLRLRNHDATFNNLTTVSVRSNLEFNVTPLLTATAIVERDDGPADLLGSSSFISTSETAALDYEYRRNVIFSTSFSRAHRLYTGISGTDTTVQGLAKVRWLLNRSLKLEMAYTLTTRNSPYPIYLGQNFKDRTVDIEVELAR